MNKKTERAARERGGGGVTVRVARAEDGEAVRRLRRQAEEHHARIRPEYFRVGPTARAVGNGSAVTVLVAEEAGAVVGYVSVKVVETPPDPGLVPRPRAFVDTIVVDEARRRSGVGRALMRAARAHAEQRGAAEIVLTVWSANRAAEAFYRALGYEDVARVLSQPLV